MLLLALRLFWRWRKGRSGAALLIGWNAALLVFFLSIVFAGGETYYRFFVDTTDTFALNKVSKRWGERYYAFNNFNSRDNIDFERQRSGKRRITFLGDSFTAGHGIKNVDDRLGNLIRAKHPEWEVHVMALNGIETLDLIEFVPKITDVDHYELDVVVLGYCMNDISPLTPGISQTYDRIYSFAESLNWLERESYFANTMAFRLMAINEPAFEGYFNRLHNTYSGQTWETQQNIMRDLVQQIRSRGGQLVVITWPFIGLTDANYLFADTHQKLDDFWKSQHVPHLDLSPILAQKAPDELVVNAWDAHPNEAANALVLPAVEALLESVVSGSQ